jgi:hypothetical protein
MFSQPFNTPRMRFLAGFNPRRNRLYALGYCFLERSLNVTAELRFALGENERLERLRL